MRILVTGATGFVGMHLIRALSTDENEILCLVREKSDVKDIIGLKNVTVKRTDFDNEHALRTCCDNIHTIIHLAGQMGAYGIPYETFYRTNCVLTEKLLCAAKKADVTHFIYCSTPGVLGFGKRLARETEPFAPRNAYEKTKVIAENIVKDFCEQNVEMHYTILRPDFVYGPGDTRRIKMYRGIRDKKFVLTTSGKSYLHPTYIEDVISGILCCIGNENSYNDIFNIAAESDITSKEYLDTIAKCTHSKLIQLNIGIVLSRFCAGIIDRLFQKIFHKEGFVSKNKIDFLAMDHSSSIEHAKRKIGYAPCFSCEEGMKRTIQWCIENKFM